MRKELKQARKASFLTQEKLAKAVGIDRTIYNRIERGRMNPKVDVAIRIAEILNKPVNEIFLPSNVNLKHNT